MQQPVDLAVVVAGSKLFQARVAVCPVTEGGT